jgi:hypothetical protein
MPATLFPGPPRPPHEGHRFWYATFASPLVAAALPAVAARYETTTSTVLYAALCAALAARTGADHCPMALIASNRIRPGTADSLAPYSLMTPATVPIAGRTAAELLRGAASASLTALRRGSYHPSVRDDVTREVAAARGTDLDLSLYFNDTRPADTRREPGATEPFDPDSGLQPGTAVWGDHTDRGDSTMFVYVNGTDARLGMYVMFDTTRISIAAAESLLADVERTLVDLVRADTRIAL